MSGRQLLRWKYPNVISNRSRYRDAIFLKWLLFPGHSFGDCVVITFGGSLLRSCGEHVTIGVNDKFQLNHSEDPLPVINRSWLAKDFVIPNLVSTDLVVRPGVDCGISGV